MTRQITRLLVANRGEIASRVIRTCHDLGIETVAVFSDPDRGLPFVDEATYAVALGGTTSAESYLDAAKVLDAARRTGADAVHPGYGFLSENPAFAEAVTAAGLLWIGPTPASMHAMALKVEAKRIAADAGVPLVPGAELAPDIADPDLLTTGEQVGYPLLVKASAGGGGKGMRVVRDAAGLEEAVAGARREAASSFGDPTVFLERYVERARHVEVQVFGDAHGGLVHLFERECSIQRRHQKVLEESPSPGATSETLERMYAAALSLARAIGYVGAGTVEFLVDGDGPAQQFFFLEMNTRLQVEHPVTERVTGLDLVEWQLRVAQGEPLPLTQDAIGRDGHAIEVRLYAEDPANGYLPSTGTIEHWTLHGYDSPVRVDSAVGHGSVVSPYYDPMLAKLVSAAPTRPEAAQALERELRRAGIGGVRTNAAMLAAVLSSEAFLEGDTTTSFLDEHPDLVAPAGDAQGLRRRLLGAAVAILDGPSTWTGAATTGRGITGWRNVPGVPETLTLRYVDCAAERVAVVAREWGRSGATYWLCPDVDGSVVQAQTIATDTRFERVDGVRFDSSYTWQLDLDREGRLEVGGLRSGASIRVHTDRPAVDGIWRAGAIRGATVSDDGGSLDVVVVEPWATSSAHAGAGAGPSTPVPGTVTHVAIEVGQRVAAGDPLVVLEAMKMEHTIRADADGVVHAVHVQVGQGVDAHTVVATLEASS